MKQTNKQTALTYTFKIEIWSPWGRSQRVPTPWLLGEPSLLQKFYQVTFNTDSFGYSMLNHNMHFFWFTKLVSEKFGNIANLTLWNPDELLLGAVEPQQWFVEWVWEGLELGLGPFLPPFSPLSAPPFLLIPLQPAPSTSLPLTPLSLSLSALPQLWLSQKQNNVFLFFLSIQASTNIKVQCQRYIHTQRCLFFEKWLINLCLCIINYQVFAFPLKSTV